MRYIVVLITASSEKEANKIANGLLDSRAVACVNIIPRIKSVFIWKGKKESAGEWLLLAKTRQDKFNTVKRIVKKSHSYQTPEIISIPILKGNTAYLKWIEEVLA